MQSSAEPKAAEPAAEPTLAVGGDPLAETRRRVRELESENARLHNELETLHSVVATLPVVLFAVDREGRFVVSEGGGLSTLGLRAKEVVGRSVFEVYAGVSWVVQGIRRALSGERFTGLGRVGDVFFESTYVPTRDPDGTVSGTLGLALDVTKRVRWEREREVLIEQLRAALSLRDEFLSIASHELRTPLASLRLRLELLLARARSAGATMPAGEVLAAAEHLDALTGRLARLVDALFDVSAVTLGHLQLRLSDLDLSALALRVATRLRPQFERASRELVVQAPDPVWGRWDRARIEQIVENLLSNALKHGAGRVELDVALAGRRAVLRVHDEGAGIPPEARSRVFDRYSRLAPKSLAGLGIGLYVCREIVEAHGGTIAIESQPGAGTSLVVSLPLSPPEASGEC